jgi:hypothetical protein
MISIIAIDPGTWLDDLASAIVFIVFGIICLMAALDGDHKRWSTTVIIVATICETARIGLTGADELTPIVMFSGAFFVTLTRYKTSRIRSETSVGQVHRSDPTSVLPRQGKKHWLLRNVRQIA